MGATTPVPVVAISTYSVDADWKSWAGNSSLTPNTYVRRLRDAGAAPVLLPPLAGNPDRLLDAVDALVLIGGEDVCGVHAGREESAEAHVTHNADRDAFEIALAQRAWARDVPVLGICRGMQVLNVARGGTLVEDLESAGASGEHLVQRGVFNDHVVKFTPGSRVSQLFGGETTVPSHHHQGIDELGEGLRVSGLASDSVIEAIEAPALHFCLGVQWHPEEGDDPTLFQALVTAALHG